MSLRCENLPSWSFCSSLAVIEHPHRRLSDPSLGWAAGWCAARRASRHRWCTAARPWRQGPCLLTLTSLSTSRLVQSKMISSESDEKSLRIACLFRMRNVLSNSESQTWLELQCLESLNNYSSQTSSYFFVMRQTWISEISIRRRGLGGPARSVAMRPPRRRKPRRSKSIWEKTSSGFPYMIQHEFCFPILWYNMFFIDQRCGKTNVCFVRWCSPRATFPDTNLRY